MEVLFGKSRMPLWIRPTIGGLCVGALALITPAVLSSGHSALEVGFGAYYTVPVLVMLIVLKVLASAISIGSGFRGGLFPILPRCGCRDLTTKFLVLPVVRCLSAHAYLLSYRAGAISRSQSSRALFGLSLLVWHADCFVSFAS